MIGLAKLAWRNFSRHLTRYRVLLSALSLVVMTLVIVLGTVLGMTHTLRGKASRYFAGSVAVQSFRTSGLSEIRSPDEVTSSIAELSIQPEAFSRRSVAYTGDASLFHAGYYIPQRRLIGVEWGLEAPILENFDFVSGGLPDAEGQFPDASSSILISSAAAETIRAQVGDELIVSYTTDSGQLNTASLVVAGIFAEASFFGYTSYMDRRTLNRLKNVPVDTVNEMGIYVDSAEKELPAARELLHKLNAVSDTFPMITTREERDRYLDEEWEGSRYMVLTLEAQLAEITDLLDALGLVAGTVILLFLGIVVVGVGNTYTMIVYERTREIGTLRALGLTRSRTVSLFLLEAAWLGVIGILVGIAAGIGVLSLIRAAGDFSGYTWATLFLTRGHLQWRLPLVWISGTAGITLLAVLVGSLRASIAASKVSPVTAMQTD